MEPLYRLNESDQLGELTWENGQLGFQGLVPARSTWGAANETLDSIVQQGSTVFQHQPQYSPANINSCSSFAAKSSHTNPNTWLDDKVESLDCGTKLRESNTAMKTRIAEELLVYHHGTDTKSEARESKGGARHSNSSRRSRTAAVHNQSERIRRDRINQKMKTLQKLVPNASKTDKASLLDEVIKYLKQLEAQIQMTSYIRNMPQMMVPFGMQQQQLQNQMSPLLAQTSMNMSMGLLGMGRMLNMMHMPRTVPLQSVPQQLHPSTSNSTNPTFPPHFLMVPPVVPTSHISQAMNMELYGKMAALCAQQDKKTTTLQEKSGHTSR